MKRSSFEMYVLDQLQQVAPITTRRMFGCIGVYSNTTFFAVVDDSGAYFKVDAQNRPEYEARGMEAFAPFANGKQIQSFYQLPDDVLDDSDILPEWVEAAIAAANRKKG